MPIFNNVSNIGQTTFTDLLRTNLISMLDYSFLEIGAFFNNNSVASGLYGGDFAQLRPQNDPSFSSGKVWAARRQNWVWESGVGAIQISGVYVNGTLQTSGYYVDYPRGRLVFNTALPLTSTVKINHSSKYIKVMDFFSTPFFNRIDKFSFRPDNANFINSSGSQPLNDNDLQLPLIAIETINNRTDEPFELGNLAKWQYNRVVFHVIGSDKSSCDKIADILHKLNDQTVFLYNPQKAAQLGKLPLDESGRLINPSGFYVNLIQPTGNGWCQATDLIRAGNIRFEEMSIENGNYITNELYQIPVNGRVVAIF
jgi:hypothetical protein